MTNFPEPNRYRAYSWHRFCSLAIDWNTITSMSSRLDKSWFVLVSHQTAEGNRCVDIFSRPNGSFGFEEFRKDPEDLGAWTPISYFSGHEYPTESDATIAARRAIPWLAPVLDR